MGDSLREAGIDQVSLTDSSNDKSRDTLLARNIGIYGAREAGKTCYLATALLGKSSSSLCTVVLHDDSSRDYLNGQYEYLERGEQPPATVMKRPDSIAGYLIVEPNDSASAGSVDAEKEATLQDPPNSATKRRFDFRTADFSGKLCERGSAETAPSTFVEIFKKLLADADCLLFFLAVDQIQDPNEGRERLLEVDAVLSHLLQSSPGAQSVNQPIAVLITKWDLISDLSGTLEEEQNKLRSFLENEAGELGRDIWEKVARAGDRAKLFPVSTFGGHIDGRPVHPIRPFGLHEPLVWVLQQTDQLLLQRAEQKAQAALERLFWKDYSTALAAYRQLVDDYGIRSGPVYETVSQRITELKQARTRRSLRTFLFCCLALVLAVAWGSFEWDRRQYLALCASLGSPGGGFAELESLKNSYLRQNNPWATVLGHKNHIRALWDEYKQKHDAEFNKVKEIREKLITVPPDQQRPLALQLWQLCNDFSERYKDSPVLDLINTWKQNAQELVKAEEDSLLGLATPLIEKAKGLLEGDTHDVLAVDGTVSEIDEMLERIKDWPSGSKVAGARVNLEQLKGQLQDKTKTLGSTAEGLSRRAQELLAEFDELSNQANLDLQQLERFLKKAEELLKEMALWPSGSAVNEQRDALSKTYEKANGLLDNYKRFDDAYDKLTKELASMSAEEKLKKIAEFRQRFPQWEYGQRQNTFLEIEKQEQELLQTLEDKRWGELNSELEEFIDNVKGADLENIDSLCKAFPNLREKVNKYCQATEPVPKYNEEAKRKLNEAQVALDDRWWELIDNLRKDSKDYDSLRKNARKYLGDQNIEHRHQKDAQELIRECLEKRWKELYLAFYERATKVDTVESLKDAESRAKECRDWLNQTSEDRQSFPPSEQVTKQSHAVEQWLRWSENFGGKSETSREIKVTVDPRTSGTGRKMWFSVSLDGKKLVILERNDTESDWFDQPREWSLILLRPLEGKETIRIEAVLDAWGPWNNPGSVEKNVIELFGKLQGNVQVRISWYWYGDRDVYVDFKFTGDLVAPTLPNP